MARIRTIKPEFFRHEGLQDLEAANVGKYPMMVFAGLWGHCDKSGVFEWRPRQLKLDILPFLTFDMMETLEMLADAGFVNHYIVDGKEYGSIPSFVDHQRINGKEAQEPSRYPQNPTENKQGSNGEATGKQPRSQEGKGREGKLNTLSGKPDGDQPEKPKKPNETAQAKEALDYLNAKTGKNYQSVDANIKPLKARIKETDLATVKAVIDRKVADWQYDEKMQEFLRPATLFNATKFASYAGDAGGNSIPAWER